jgi:hypothetical protein
MSEVKRCVVLLLVLLALAITSSAYAGPLPGAIFTTLIDGSAVNHNIYGAKEDVYLDGGPGPNAPSTAAGLPEGDYYFQVTDPSGKVLLSVDPIASRKVHVNAAGVIDYVYPAPTLTKYKGKWYGTHATGIDQDHSELGARTVQLMPFADTPNPGGEYKVWMTPVVYYTPGQGKFGFLPAWSKTDNYKAKGKPFVPPMLIVRNFRDSNANGIWNLGEEELFGWPVDVTDPLTVVNTYYTQVETQASTPGWYSSNETMPTGWQQTALYIDGVAQPVSPTANVQFAGNSAEIHTVIYGKIQLGRICWAKFFDTNGDSIRQFGLEALIVGWKARLDGVAVDGTEVHIEDFTGASGCSQLRPLPGHYFLSEVMPLGNWEPTTATSFEIWVGEGDEVHVCFGNVCTGVAAFSTKGYWHNRNGISEENQSDYDYANPLAPYCAPSPYFGAGDEPFDGYYANGTPVAQANGDWGEFIAPAGSPQAEVSHFLVDSNANGDPREQLAQQLLAFIFNVRHRLDGMDASIFTGNTYGWIPASDLIASAVTIWETGSAFSRTQMAGLLDALNNCDAVEYIHSEPCEVVYP